jgi:hypothetical protein
MKRTLAPILLLLLLSACTDSDLKKLAQGLDIAAQNIVILQTTVIEANRQGLMTDEETRPIVQACVVASNAGMNVDAVIRPLTSLQLSDKQLIMKILAPAVQAVQDMLNKDLLYIKNEQSKQKARACLLIVESALNTVQLILAAS